MVGNPFRELVGIMSLYFYTVYMMKCFLYVLYILKHFCTLCIYFLIKNNFMQPKRFFQSYVCPGATLLLRLCSCTVLLKAYNVCKEGTARSLS